MLRTVPRYRGRQPSLLQHMMQRETCIICERSHQRLTAPIPVGHSSHWPLYTCPTASHLAPMLPQWSLNPQPRGTHIALPRWATRTQRDGLATANLIKIGWKQNFRKFVSLPHRLGGGMSTFQNFENLTSDLVLGGQKTI